MGSKNREQGMVTRLIRTESVSFPITDIDTFVGQLKMVKAKYIEWERVAKENNITTKIVQDFMPEGPQPIRAYLEWDFAHETHRTSTKGRDGSLIC